MNDERLGLPSCSSLSRLEKCPYSLTYDKQPERKTTSPLAEKGTRIHAFLSGEPILLNEEEFGIANSCKLITDRVIEAWAGDEGTQELLKEERVFYEKDGKKLFSGKPDLVIAKRDQNMKGHLLVIDYKTGPTEYETASQNLQLRGLSVAIRQFIKREFDEEIEDISCVIIQPLVTWSPVVVTYTKEHLDLAEEEIVGICTAPMQGPVPNRYCQYCGGFVTCPACLNATKALTIIRPDVFQMVVQKSPSERRKMYNTACLAIKTATAIIEACKEVLSHDGIIPGLKLKEGRNMRTISTEGVKFAASKVMPQDSIMKASKVSVNELYNEFYALKNKIEPITHKQCRELFENIFGDYITIKKSKPIISVESND